MPPQIARSTVTRAHVAAIALHFLMGIAGATWVTRLPAIRDALSLDPSDIGLMLLIGSLGSLVSLPVTGPLSMRIGTRGTLRIGGTAWVLGMVLLGLSVPSVSRVILAAGFVGVSFGGSMWASTMNIEVGYHEAATRRALQFRFHAFYSIGTVLGALIAAAVIRAGVATQVHLWVIAGLILATVWGASFVFLPRSFADHYTAEAQRAGIDTKGRTRRAWRERRTILIAFMVLGGGLLEGSANDWLTLSMVDGYGLDQAHASMAMSLFLATMASMRLLSALLLRRFAVEHLLRVLLSGAVVGLLLVAFSPSTPLALGGIVLWAAGAALVFPAGTSALSTDPTMTAARISVLATINYGSALVGPPLLGLIAEHIGYHRMLAVLVIPVTVAIILTPNLVKRDEDGQD